MNNIAIKMCEVNEVGDIRFKVSPICSSIIYSPGRNRPSKSLSHIPGPNIQLNKNILRRLIWYNF